MLEKPGSECQPLESGSRLATAGRNVALSSGTCLGCGQGGRFEGAKLSDLLNDVGSSAIFPGIESPADEPAKSPDNEYRDRTGQITVWMHLLPHV